MVVTSLLLSVSDTSCRFHSLAEPYLSRRSKSRQVLWNTKLYSSLTPYAMISSGNSVITAFAASFMRSSALRSFGFSKEYLLANLDFIRRMFRLFHLRMRSYAYFVNPRPSILTTIHVFGRSTSGCSNCFTYSHLRTGESERSFPHRWDEVKRTLNLPYCNAVA